jgi:hypothetical protein
VLLLLLLLNRVLRVAMLAREVGLALDALFSSATCLLLSGLAVGVFEQVESWGRTTAAPCWLDLYAKHVRGMLVNFQVAVTSRTQCDKREQGRKRRRPR